MEVLLVIAILLVVGAMAIPNMLNVIATARLRAGLTNMSGVLQNCRMMAVKKNATMITKFSPQPYGIVGYIKESTDSSPLKPTDPQVEWEAPIIQYPSSVGNGGPADIDTTTLGFTPLTIEPSFNSRGLPCSGTNCGTVSGFIYYFRDTRQSGLNGWAAVSISPAGRIKKWYWSGSTWTE